MLLKPSNRSQILQIKQNKYRNEELGRFFKDWIH